MDNRWSDADAEAAVERYTKEGAGLDLALRTYSTRLLGAEPRLVIHGGGNTSVKTTMRPLTGDEVEVLCVKGSGWDMATIEPAGLPAVRLDALRPLANLEALSDEDMVNAQRGALLDASAPNPSVETLLHAFLPHKYIDHTHANSVLALTDQPDPAALCREVYGETMALVPYVKPGFALALQAMQIFRDRPAVEGMILLRHGIFTFGETAREAYDRMIEKVSLAEHRLTRAGRGPLAGVSVHRRRPKSFAPIRLPQHIAAPAKVAPILRGLAALAHGDRRYQRWILDFRTSPQILDFVNGTELERYARQGTATPDHVIRTKRLPLITPVANAQEMAEFATGAKAAMDDYQSAYHAYFAEHNARQKIPKTELDPVPRVILVPGLGLFGLGASAAAAKAAADLAETNVEVISGAELIGTFAPVSEADAFDIEYWSLEQAKLGKATEKPLARHVVMITGGGSGIGAACAGAFRAAGAEVCVVDIDAARAQAVADRVGGLALGCDVTQAQAVEAAFAGVAERFGGVDVVVSNAGHAWQGRIGEVDDEILRSSFELNFWAHQRVARVAVEMMLAQKTGGCLLFNASKQAVNPGPGFGPYGLPKAATVALMRQYALDYGRDGIRSCAVNADRVRTGLLDQEMIAGRAKARGISIAAYMSGNLLGVEVTAEDVAAAFVDLALAHKTSAAILTVDGGNIAAGLR